MQKVFSIFIIFCTAFACFIIFSKKKKFIIIFKYILNIKKVNIKLFSLVILFKALTTIYNIIALFI